MNSFSAQVLTDPDTRLLVIDRSDPTRWFAWVREAGTLGFVSSVPQAMRQAAEQETPCTHYIFLDSNVPMRY